MAVGCLDKRSEIKTREMFAELDTLLGDRFEGKINISLEEMDQFYYDLDIYILTSNKNTESFGRTLVEAMSRNTVVLTTDAGGAVEVVGDSSKVCQSVEEFINLASQLHKDTNL